MKKLALICISLTALIVIYLFIQGQRSATIVAPDLAYKPLENADDSQRDAQYAASSGAVENHSQHSGPTQANANSPEQNQTAANTESPAATKEKMFDGLKHKYAVGAETQRQPLWQMQTLDDLRVIFQQRFGENWLEEMNEFLRIAFPELADQLIERMSAYLDYERWTEELTQMTFSSVEARQDAMWDKRYELFGEDAELIWISEHQDRLTNTGLKALEYRGDFQEQRLQYKALLQEVYGDDDAKSQSPTQMSRSHNFLSLEGVQDNLHAMSSHGQIEALRELRQDLGLDEAALHRLATLDAQRAATWEKGMRYEAQRKSVSESVSQEQQNQLLEQLRVELFGETEAEFIRSEEAAGFYRFQSRQKIGIN